MLVAIDGSAPLDVGASMYVDAEGVIEGSVTGGCVESAVAQEAHGHARGAAAAPRLVTYGISDDLAGTVGLMCGGTVHIFIHELRRGRARRGARRPRGVRRRPAQRGRHAAGRRAARAARCTSTRSARVGGARRPGAARRQRRARGARARRPRPHAVRHFGEDGTTLGTGLRVHVTAHAEPPRMVDLRRDRLLRRAGAARQRAGLPGDDRRPAPRVPGLARASPPTRRRSRRGPTGGRSSGSRSARATRCSSSPTTPSSTCRR